MSTPVKVRLLVFELGETRENIDPRVGDPRDSIVAARRPALLVLYDCGTTDEPEPEDLPRHIGDLLGELGQWVAVDSADRAEPDGVHPLAPSYTVPKTRRLREITYKLSGAADPDWSRDLGRTLLGAVGIKLGGET